MFFFLALTLGATATDTSNSSLSSVSKWAPLNTAELFVKPGSALDFSRFFDQSPAGAFGRVTVTKNGALAYSSKPETAIRFFSFQLMPPPDLRMWSDKEITEYAAAISRQGYNMVRIHGFDDFLVGNDKAADLKLPKDYRYSLPDRSDEIKFEPRALDRYQFLLSELKKHGIYWNVDFMTSFVGYSNGRFKPRGISPQGAFNTKVQLYINPNFRENWKAAVSKLLDTVNPYTGMAMKDDPALAFATCLNEQEILFERRNYGRELDIPWHKFLKKKYSDYSTLRAAWGGKCGRYILPVEGAIENVPPIAAPVVLSDSPAGRDMAQCCSELEVEMTQYFLDTLHEIGYVGLTSNWNMRTRIGSVPARSLLPIVTMNSYYAHPNFGPPVVVDQSSSLADGGASFKNQTVARFLDRPFVNTEFGLVFWNRYRHEQGLLFGAGASFQGWSGINCHADPGAGAVLDTGEALSWFHIGGDPVMRAAEAIEALAFRRSDIAPSNHTIEIPLNSEFIYAGRSMHAVDDELSRLWVLCRLGITFGEKKSDYPVTLSVSPDKTSSIAGSLWFSDVEKSDSTSQLSAIVTKLKELKVLSSSNLSDPSEGILQSDTGEITLLTQYGEIVVISPRLEGTVLKRDRPRKLDAFSVEKCSVPASVSLASLDSDRSLREASRLLLVFSTDARNSGMVFTNLKEDTIEDLGQLPILVKTGELQVSLTRSVAPKSVQVFALKLNGDRAEEIPVVQKGQDISLKIQTDLLAVSGPTPFFEIVIE